MTDLLRKTINHLAKGREIVQRQRDLLAKLNSKDLPTLDAEQMLRVFQISLTTFERCQWELLRELSATPRASDDPPKDDNLSSFGVRRRRPT